MLAMCMPFYRNVVVLFPFAIYAFDIRYPVCTSPGIQVLDPLLLSYVQIFTVSPMFLRFGWHFRECVDIDLSQPTSRFPCKS